MVKKLGSLNPYSLHHSDTIIKYQELFNYGNDFKAVNIKVRSRICQEFSD